MEDTSTHAGGEAAIPELGRAGAARAHPAREMLFGSPRDFHDNSYVYTVLSARAHGLAVGVNMCPERDCNFYCLYCEVHREGAPKCVMDVAVMAGELRRTLAMVNLGRLRECPGYRALPDELLQLRHVALSGDGEPTLSPSFADAVQAVVHVRAVGGFPFKLVLMTNGTGLDLPRVQDGLRFLTKSDEIWAKLDGGTQTYINKVNHPNIPLEKILSNLLLVGRHRPLIIQSLFPAIDGEEPPLEEIEQYSNRLRDLRDGGAQISLVQIYSATRPAPNSRSGHLPLKVLSRIAHLVRQSTGLKAEVF